MCTGSLLGVKRPGRGVDHPPQLAPRLKKRQSYTSTPLLAFVACYRVNFTNNLMLIPWILSPQNVFVFGMDLRVRTAIVSLHGIKECTLFSVRYELNLYLACCPGVYNMLAEFCVLADYMKFSTQNGG
jgi:hypothetical protein